MRYFIIIMALLLSPNLVLAQDGGRMAAAKQFVTSPGQQAMLDGILSKDVIISQLYAMAPAVPDDDKDVIATIVAQELDDFRPAMEAAVISALTKHFTLDEIKAMTDFYSTPEGASIGAKMQPYTIEVYQIMGPQLQRMQNNIIQKLSDYKSKQN